MNYASDTSERNQDKEDNPNMVNIGMLRDTYKPPCSKQWHIMRTQQEDDVQRVIRVHRHTNESETDNMA